jgi:hypothetical protein
MATPNRSAHGRRDSRIPARSVTPPSLKSRMMAGSSLTRWHLRYNRAVRTRDSMGFDCTLHLVDEELIRKELVPRLLSDGPPPSLRDRLFRRSPRFPPTVLDRRRRDAPRLWKRARRALRMTSPETAARCIAELALLFNSCELPFEPSRNVALSLWGGLHEELPDVIPDELLGSPDELFGDLIEAFPALKGCFPDYFDGNGSLGVYVSAVKVPALAKWVEEQIGRLDKGERAGLLTVARVLKVAAIEGYGYWEATEIDVEWTESDLLRRKTTSAPAARKHIVPFPTFLATGYSGTRILLSDQDGRRTALFDLESWPPRELARIERYTLAGARSSDGRWALLTSRERGRIDARVLSSRLDPASTLLLAGGDAGREIGWLGERVVVLPGIDGLTPLIERSGRLEAPRELPAPVPCTQHFGAARGAVRVGDGTNILIHDGDGYAVADGTLERVLDLHIDSSYWPWSCVQSGSDGFYFLSNRRLYEVHRGGKPVRHLLGLDNIMEISEGPPGWLLLREGDNRLGDVGKAYCPATSVLFSLTREPLGLDVDDLLDSVYWSPGSESVLLRVKPVFWAVPWRLVTSQEPVSLRKRHDNVSAEVSSDDPVWTDLPVTYRDGVARRLSTFWTYQKPHATGDVSLSFEIAPDGTPGSIDIASTADQLSALAGRKAVAEAGPFRPIGSGGAKVNAVLRAPRSKRTRDLAP